MEVLNKKLNTPIPAPHLNSCKGSPLLEGSWKPAAVRSVASDNSVNEYNKDIVTEMEESNYGSVEPSSPSGMWGLMRI